MHYFSVFSKFFLSFSKSQNSFVMAAMLKFEEFDSERLKKFKRSLSCFKCKKPPRPEAKVYSHARGYPCHQNERLIGCKDCRYCSKGKETILDLGLTEFVSCFKLFNCINLNNGCNEELEAKDLDAHERICVFRDVTCPEYPCGDTITFNEIMDHYDIEHGVYTSDNVFDFKGNRDELDQPCYILNSYGKPFFLQFRFDEDWLYIWVIGHGDQDEINSFEAYIKVFVNGKLKHSFNDTVKSIDVDRSLLMTGKSGIVIPVENLTQYYDVESKQFKNQKFIELQLKIVSEKLDEVAKAQCDNFENLPNFKEFS